MRYSERILKEVERINSMNASTNKYKRIDGMHDIAETLSNNSQLKLIKLAEYIAMVRKQKKIFNNQDGSVMLSIDGGPGSGNWGHSGRPGKVGGSGKGGGVANRLSTPTGGFTSRSQAEKENKARGGGGKSGGGPNGAKKISNELSDKEFGLLKSSCYISSDDTALVGNKGVYNVYRVGSINGSDLGYISFGLDKSYAKKYMQKSVHEGQLLHNYDVAVQNPLYVKAKTNRGAYNMVYNELFSTDIPYGMIEMHDGTLQRTISKELKRRGYDSIVFDIRNYNYFEDSWEDESEVLLLNEYKKNIRI